MRHIMPIITSSTAAPRRSSRSISIRRPATIDYASLRDGARPVSRTAAPSNLMTVPGFLQRETPTIEMTHAHHQRD
jgi:hypothetical protein